MTDLLRQVANYYSDSLPPDLLPIPIPPIPADTAVEVVGGPGDFLPTGCVTPTVAQLTSNPVVASPLTAWSTGSHMVATDGNAFWDGTAWVPGIAAAADEPASEPASGGGAPQRKRNGNGRPKT